MLDDLFLFHEEMFPKYFGIPEKGVFVIYSNILLLYALLFRETIFKTDYLILGLAFFLIGGSTFVKRIPMPIPEDTFLEDAVKLFGILCWFTYFLRLGFRELKKVYDKKITPPYWEINVNALKWMDAFIQMEGCRLPAGFILPRSKST